MAHGGEVEHFCSESRMHHPSCEYFTSEPHDSSMDVNYYLSHAGFHSLIDQAEKSHPDINQAILRHHHRIKKGKKRFHDSIEHLFGDKDFDHGDSSKGEQVIHEWLEKGGVVHDLQHELHRQNEPVMMAEGGEVEPKEMKLHDKHIANSYPEHNMLMQATKGRASAYLNGLKPQKHMPKLAFDDEPDTRDQEKSYKKAVSIAANPLQVLSKIKKGTIEPEHVKHLQNLYPEMTDALKSKMIEKITDAQLKGKKPSYKIRQGMSLLLGVPLSGEMSPQNIQAAQATFANKGQPQNQAQPATKTKPSAITKLDDRYVTSEQARIIRQQKQ